MGSRRAHSSRQAPPPEEFEETEETLADPVINGIQFGINSVRKFITEVLPTCPTGNINSFINIFINITAKIKVLEIGLR